MRPKWQMLTKDNDKQAETYDTYHRRAAPSPGQQQYYKRFNSDLLDKVRCVALSG